jgi:hypothetical protein
MHCPEVIIKKAVLRATENITHGECVYQECGTRSGDSGGTCEALTHCQPARYPRTKWMLVQIHQDPWSFRSQINKISTTLRTLNSTTKYRTVNKLTVIHQGRQESDSLIAASLASSIAI